MTDERASRTQSLERLTSWRNEYKTGLAPSPLEDISQLGAKLDLTHAHPSGISQLFAKGSAPLHSLFRDGGMLRAAARRVERVLEEQTAKKNTSGIAELSLIVGVGSWKGNQMPVLLYPVEIVQDGQPVENHTTISFTGRVRLNASFVSLMREHGVNLDESALFDGKNYESGTPETASVFAAITNAARKVFADFSIERQIIVGCFLDPATQVLVESQLIIDELAKGPTGNTMLDVLAGDSEAKAELQHQKMPAHSPFDGDPHAEFEVGDVDNTVRYAANMVAAGHSLFVDGTLVADTADQAAAIASRCIMAGKTVLYVPGVTEQKRRFKHAMRANELDGAVLDVADSKTNESIDHQLIQAVGLQQGVAASRFEQLADELVGVRARLTRYLGDLHGKNETWGVSAYQTIQNLANIAELPTHPATHVRLTKQVALNIGKDLPGWAQKLARAGELGEYTLIAQDTPWYSASVFNEAEAIGAYQRVSDLLLKLLPATREQVAAVVRKCGFPVPNTAMEWARQVTVLKNLRRVLDVFQAEIFERDIDAMIEATKPKAERKADGAAMGYWERRRHIKEAKSLLRPGAQVENLHEALLVVDRQAAQWRMFVPHGGWPVLPSHLDEIMATQAELDQNITALDMMLSTTPQGGDLGSTDFNVVEERLKALYDDKIALDTLPERSMLERELHQAGLSDLVNDLRNRHVEVNAVGDELRLAWWMTVFDDIVHSSAIISNQDGSVLQTASERFVQVDTEHVRSVGPMVMQESMRRLRDLLFARTQEANMLHTALASATNVPIGRIHHDHAQILAAAKPVIMATPATLAAVTNPAPIADVVILDAAAHLPSVLLLGILARARQAVVLAHRQTITSEAINLLVNAMPSVRVPSRPTRRDPRVNEFLEAEGYGSVNRDAVRKSVQGTVRYHRVDGAGVPVIETGLVESSQVEIDEIIRLITERAKTFTIIPTGYILTVVTLTTTFRTRLGAELKMLAARDENMGRFLRHVRIVDIMDVAGASATDVILSMSYAKTSHGRLLQQFGDIESEGGKGMLLDTLALADHNIDIVSAFGTSDMEDERIHQPGALMLKKLLGWAEQLKDDEVVRPAIEDHSDNVLFNDLAERVRARGLNVALNYGYEGGMRIPMVVGAQDQPFALALLTDDAQFMNIESTRERNRILLQDLEGLGWSVMTVWSVGAFVNPEKEVDRIVARLGDLYQEPAK
ncbi:helicase [Bifidobacterium dolichotidis]|uniref:Helicase n=1 Tax=Bifidobacterium dolichotidis TaxID=2306976 RepID=A0A430FQB3_9BIFI|nr:helicase [Bifidobacterium dolichotidis]RSX55008.1 helicase [Bifidobacterium dolichotidis]